MEKEFILLTQSQALIQKMYYLSLMSSKDHTNRGLFNGNSFSIGLSLDPQRFPEFLSDPYFKLSIADSINVKDPEGISRIYFKNLRIEKDNDNNPEVKININVLKDLNIAMTEYYCNYSNGIRYTIFDAMNKLLDDFASSHGYKYEYVNECPDFTVLESYTTPNNAIKLC
jgi:hypothetical protein